VGLFVVYCERSLPQKTLEKGLTYRTQGSLLERGRKKRNFIREGGDIDKKKKELRVNETRRNSGVGGSR